MSRAVSSVDAFHAIADPTRRALLGLLRTAPEQTLTDLAAPFAVTLSAISQHLRVLREANLVAVRKVGRERRYRLTADPLREVAEWTHAYEAFWDDRMTALGAFLDDDKESENSP